MSIIYYLPNEILLYIMSFEDVYALTKNLCINKHMNQLATINMKNICLQLLDKKKIKLIETPSAYNLCKKNHTTSIAKNKKSSLNKAMHLSRLY